MNMIAEKYRLLKWLVSIEDEAIIAKLKEVQKNASEINSTQEPTSATENLFIEAGLKDIEEGNTWTHEQVLQEVRAKYGI